jgi:hypothetical protein
MVLELEDRDGTDMCMWLYHICCAMGGELRQDKGSRTIAAKNEMCPAGTICCPKTDPVKGDDKKLPVPWHEETLNLLRVLAHGKLKYTPAFGADDALNAWKDRDPISSTGPAQCVDQATFKAVFPDGEGFTKSRTRQHMKASHKALTESATEEVCKFGCYKKPAWYKHSVHCQDKDGRKLIVLSDPVKKGECTHTFSTSVEQEKAKKKCAKMEEQCGYKAKLISTHAYGEDLAAHRKSNSERYVSDNHGE